MTRVVIDPVTRIGGHLRIELEVRNGVVEDAWSAGTMFRGLERILEGRDPREAWLVAQRVCGMCGGSHALASVRAVEDAIGTRVPRNARLLRNLVAGAELVLDHVVAFYHLQLFDWADALAAAEADPHATADLATRTSSWGDATAGHFGTVRERLRAAIASRQLGPLANGAWGHPAYRLDAPADLLMFAHYLDALALQQRFTKLHNMLGGKSPHPQTFLVGGMTLAPAWGGPATSPRTHPRLVDRNAPSPLTAQGLDLLAGHIADVRAFVDQAYVPDVLHLAGAYRAWWTIGAGVRRFLAFGDFPVDDSATATTFLPPGVLEPAGLDRVLVPDPSRVRESVDHAHYEDDPGAAPRRPWAGRTDPRYAGPDLPYTTLAESARYSWLKAPRYGDDPAETGPLARVLVAAASRAANVTPRLDGALARLGIGRDAMPSVMGRTLARALEAQVVVHQLEAWRAELGASLATGDTAVADISRWDPASWSRVAEGRALGETPRGAVGHWIRIRDRRIADYQIVDGTTWNASPRDAAGTRGPLEEALVGVPIDDPDRPIEALRVVRSFDPCATCAVHALPDPGSRR